MKLKMIPTLIGTWIARYPIFIVLAAIVFTGLSIRAAAGIELKTELKDMLPEDNGRARSYTAILDRFDTVSVLLVTVEGRDRKRIVEASEVFANRIRNDERLKPFVKNITLKADEAFIEKWGMLFMDAESLEDNIPVFARPGLTPMVTSLNDMLESSLSDGTADEDVNSRSDEEDFVSFLDRLEMFTVTLSESLSTDADEAEAGETLSRELLYGQSYMLNPEGTMLIFSVSPTFDLADRRKLLQMTDIVRDHERAMSADYPDLTFGTAGDIASEADEERAISADITYPSFAAMFLILILFLISFRRFRSVVFALIALLLGILFDVGLSAVVVREFNMITSAFGALLVGLGIDFGVHYITRVDAEKLRTMNEREALIGTIEKTILPVSIGAVTTSLAFYSLLVSQSKAFRQFGFVAGTGILTTLVSMYTILPALLVLFPGKKRTFRSETDLGTYSENGGGTANGNPVTLPVTKIPDGDRWIWQFGFLTRLGGFVERHPVPFVVSGIVVTIAAALCIPLNRFEYDMRKIGPGATESRLTENRIIENFDLSAYPTMVLLDDFEEARSLTEALRDHPLVRKVESPTLLIPPLPEQENRLGIIRGFRRSLEDAPPVEDSGTDAAMLAAEIQRLEWNVLELSDLSVASLGEDNLIQRKRISMIREPGESGKSGHEVFQRLITLLESAGASARLRLSAIDGAFSRSMRNNLLASLSISGPITLGDLPDEIRDSMVTPDYKEYLVTAYPDSGIGEEDALLLYHDEMGKLHPGITGGLLMAVELSREMLSEAGRAFIYVAAIVILLLFISFRSIRDNVIAILGLVMSATVMLGVYQFWGRFNIVNILAVPLIMGMGIDYGVHILHAYRNDPGGLASVMRGSGKAVFLSAATTVIGFGSLVLMGSFQGIAALGKVLTVGITVSFVLAVTFVPAAAVLFSGSGKPAGKKSVSEGGKK